MKPLTEEWIKKGERDYSTMLREARVQEDPNNDAIAFHAQQCAEKYIKGYLQEIDIAFPKLHDLRLLLEILIPIQEEVNVILDDCAFLSEFAVRYRYPGEDTTKEDAEHAAISCRKIRKLIKHLLAPTDQMIL